MQYAAFRKSKGYILHCIVAKWFFRSLFAIELPQIVYSYRLMKMAVACSSISSSELVTIHSQFSLFFEKLFVNSISRKPSIASNSAPMGSTLPSPTARWCRLSIRTEAHSPHADLAIAATHHAAPTSQPVQDLHRPL